MTFTVFLVKYPCLGKCFNTQREEGTQEVCYEENTAVRRWRICGGAVRLRRAEDSAGWYDCDGRGFGYVFVDQRGHRNRLWRDALLQRTRQRRDVHRQNHRLGEFCRKGRERDDAPEGLQHERRRERIHRRLLLHKRHPANQEASGCRRRGDDHRLLSVQHRQRRQILSLGAVKRQRARLCLQQRP